MFIKHLIFQNQDFDKTGATIQSCSVKKENLEKYGKFQEWILMFFE